ncbi:hypothetical protein RRG08_029310 [Elysia crispata]|uniref:GH18 domain-containing protein n=1 Tax=Elysia crispata TaxID=231223 RepID=A0AAE1DU21_9GAST|nr:hypothetical protein RRG08_029310 [Elysia crispata]
MPTKRELSPEQVEEIHSLRGQLPAAEVKKRFGIGTTRLYRIWRDGDSPTAGALDPPLDPPLAGPLAGSLVKASPLAGAPAGPPAEPTAADFLDRLDRLEARVEEASRLLVQALAQLPKDDDSDVLEELLVDEQQEIAEQLRETRHEQAETRLDLQKVGQAVETAQNWAYISIAAVLVWRVFAATWNRGTARASSKMFALAKDGLARRRRRHRPPVRPRPANCMGRPLEARLCPWEPWFHFGLTFPYKVFCNWTVHYWRDRGLPFRQMLVGITGVGRRLVLSNVNDTEVGSPVTGEIRTGDIYGIPGGLAYPEICMMLNSIKTRGYFDYEQRVPYLVKGDDWVGYEDKQSIGVKVPWMMRLGVAGIMFWSLDQDDFSGKFCDDSKYPLLRAVKAAVDKELGPINGEEVNPDIIFLSGHNRARSKASITPLIALCSTFLIIVCTWLNGGCFLLFTPVFAG